MQSGQLQYDRKPVPGATLYDLDLRRLVNYFRDLRRQGVPEETDRESWLRLLVNTELMTEDRGRPMPSAGGLLLFGLRPNRHLPHAGISAAAYAGTEKDYDAKARATLRGPAVSLFPAPSEIAGQAACALLPSTFSETGSAVEAGVIEQAIDFVRRNTEVTARIGNDGRRLERWDYPL